MAKVLYITANPKQVNESFSLTLGQEFLNVYKKENPNDEIITLDLYKEYIPLIDEEVLSGWGKLRNQESLTESEQKKVARMNELVDQFVATDKYIFVTPLWNLSVPPMMRAYVDCIMQAGKTFKYTEQGPIGLLNGKKAVHIQARGGFYSEGHGSEVEMGDRYIRAILNFMGVTDVQSIYMEGHAYDPSRTEEFKSKAMDQVISVAKMF
ncbi:FMN-dependent NADH-azoreductase [Tepidibacillus sp. LV47]|uniref:FMN-dependent NADH-azoreductase n=1 Tax=Tepidibacillus sp. LV47 TaxID=3398228 RepID=UPI003AABC235